MIISALPRLRAIADFANQIWQPMVNAAKFPLRSSNYQPVQLASEAHLIARCNWSQRIGDGCVIDADRPFGHTAHHFLVRGCTAKIGQSLTPCHEGPGQQIETTTRKDRVCKKW